MVPNDPDKEQCICCSEPKPGCKPKAADSSSKPSAPGSVTSSGFKFGSSSAPSNPASSGFNIGSNEPKHETEKKDYSKEYLAHLKVHLCSIYIGSSYSFLISGIKCPNLHVDQDPH